MVYSELGDIYSTSGPEVRSRLAVLEADSIVQRVFPYYKIFQFLSCYQIGGGKQGRYICIPRRLKEGSAKAG